MRAFAVKSFGDAPGICELQAPAADDSVLIRVSCAGVTSGGWSPASSVKAR